MARRIGRPDANTEWSPASAARRSPQGDDLDDESLGAAFVAGLHRTLLGWSGRADGGVVAAVEDVDGADEAEIQRLGLLVGLKRMQGRPGYRRCRASRLWPIGLRTRGVRCVVGPRGRAASAVPTTMRGGRYDAFELRPS